MAGNERTGAYHHGDLRAALLNAAEAELDEKGIEGFTLRGCAKRAGVSHAAPAHHFRDANALLTALAARGFERFVESLRAHMDAAGDDAMARLGAGGVGYVSFALDNAAVFRLMFSSERPDFESEGLCSAAETAFTQLVTMVSAARGATPDADPSVIMDVAATWSMAHGMADLLSSGRMKTISDLPETERNSVLASLMQSAVPLRK